MGRKIEWENMWVCVGTFLLVGIRYQDHLMALTWQIRCFWLYSEAHVAEGPPRGS